MNMFSIYFLLYIFFFCYLFAYFWNLWYLDSFICVHQFLIKFNFTHPPSMHPNYHFPFKLFFFKNLFSSCLLYHNINNHKYGITKRTKLKLHKCIILFTVCVNGFLALSPLMKTVERELSLLKNKPD